MSDFYTNVFNYGNSIKVRGYRDGKQFFETVKYKPKLFTTTNKDSKFRNIYGKNLEEKQFDSISDARDFIQRYKDVENFQFFGMDKWVTQYIAETYWGELKYDFNKIRILYFDIETATEGGYAKVEDPWQEVVSITMIYNGITYVLGLGDFDNKDPKVKYFKMRDEKAMLRSFINLFVKFMPDVISGWFSEGYDVPYLVNRIERVLGEGASKELSPWRMISERRIPRQDGSDYQTYDIQGVSHLDYMELFKKFSGKTPESYKLDQIAYEILGKKKVDYSKYGSLRKLYLENHQLFIEYNIQDVQLIVELEERMKLIQLASLIAYYSKVNFQDTFKNTRVWDSLIYNHLIKKNVIVDAKFDHSGSKEKIAGGYVQLPTKGRYDWVVSFDATSLYPHLIMSANISPDTFAKKYEIDVDRIVSTGKNTYRDDLVRQELSMAGNGATFVKNKKGFLVELMEELFILRTEYKDKMKEQKTLLQTAAEEDKKGIQELADYFNNYQNVLKVILNSAFGAVSAKGFRYEHSHFGEGITLSGQLVLKWGIKHSNEILNKLFKTSGFNYVIYADTDSLILNFSELGNRFQDKNRAVDEIDRVCKEFMAKFYEKIYDTLAEEMNFYASKIHFKREKIADRGIFLDEKKKRYMMNVWDEEGTRFKTPEIKVTGIESVRSTTPEKVRKALKNTFAIMLTGTKEETLEFVSNYEKEFKTYEVEDIAIPVSANNMEKYSNKSTIYGKGTPMQVRAALLYNYHLVDKGLDEQYEEIQEGDKIKMLPLNIPNPIRENIIGFPRFLPNELGLKQYVNYDSQFEKVYLGPLETIFDAVGWRMKETASFEDLF